MLGWAPVSCNLEQAKRFRKWIDALLCHISVVLTEEEASAVHLLHSVQVIETANTFTYPALKYLSFVTFYFMLITGAQVVTLCFLSFSNLSPVLYFGSRQKM